MIRLFRKIRRELMSEDKYPVYLLYAGGEILLVVIGILLALQIDNWNEKRQTREAEQLLLVGLRNEMSQNLDQLSNVMSYHDKSRNASRKLLDVYNGSYTYNNLHEVDSLLALLQWAYTYNPSMGMINSIKLSGHLNSIESEELRGLITNFEDLIEDATEETKIILNIITDKYVPGVSNYISLSQRVKYLGEDYQIGPSPFAPDYEGLFTDRSMESIISYIHTWRIDEMHEEIRLTNLMERFLALLDEEIEN